MRVLLDTNILLDHLLDRKPFSEAAATVFSLVEASKIEGVLCATTITTIDYLLKRSLPRENAMSALKALLNLFAIAPVNRAVLANAVNSNMSDFEDAVLKSIEGTQINGARNNRICNTTNIMFRGIDGRKLLAYLDTRGIRCSQSSACTNFDTAPSYVLRAMGISEEDAYSSIRFSFSEENTDEEVKSAVDIIVKGCNELRG